MSLGATPVGTWEGRGGAGGLGVDEQGLLLCLFTEPVEAPGASGCSFLELEVCVGRARKAQVGARAMQFKARRWWEGGACSL